jgi:hypothetical protein
VQDLKKRIEDLHFAIRMTQTYFRQCSTPYLKDLYLQNIDYYHAEILIAEGQLLAYTNSSAKDQ